ncbi:hypothetical protein WUBG_08791 [Wuchereria bancrofti]|nr:hypothetical protein WUBG_08791 [Wuchereria bancrofti]
MRSAETSGGAIGSSSGASAGINGYGPRATASTSFSTRRAENERGAGSGRTTAFSSHNWPDDLIDIVNEPMGQTLDRMKKYSNSLSQVDRDGTEEGGPIRERVEERYQRSYKEEYTTGRR